MCVLIQKHIQLTASAVKYILDIFSVVYTNWIRLPAVITNAVTYKYRNIKRMTDYWTENVWYLPHHRTLFGGEREQVRTWAPSLLHFPIKQFRRHRRHVSCGVYVVVHSSRAAAAWRTCQVRTNERTGAPAKRELQKGNYQNTQINPDTTWFIPDIKHQSPKHQDSLLYNRCQTWHQIPVYKT